MTDKHSDAYLAYMAGIVDLVGRFTSFASTSGSELPKLEVNMNDAQLCRWLGEQSGTNPIQTNRKYDKHVCVEHCKQAHSHVWSSSWRWGVSGAKATIISYNLLPHLIRQVDEARLAVKVGLEAPVKPATLAKMKLMGWELPEDWKIS